MGGGVMAETMADYEAEVQMRIEEHSEREWLAKQDRERIEFIRRAAIAMHATLNVSHDEAWREAKALWEARPDDC